MTIDPRDFDRIQPPRFSGDMTPEKAAAARDLVRRAKALQELGGHLENIKSRMEDMRDIFEREARRVVSEDAYFKLREDPNQALQDAAAEGREADVELLLRQRLPDLKLVGEPALALAEKNGREECARLLRAALGKTPRWWSRLLSFGPKRP